MPDSDVIVIGAGPVGMLASLLALRSGLSVILLERNVRRSSLSRAIGISPPSLEIFKKIGIDREIISQGVRVSQGEVYSTSRLLGKINFYGIKSEYRFILSVPQKMTESILEDAVKADNRLRFYGGYNVTRFSSDEDRIVISGYQVNKERFEFSASFVLACDGENSIMRKSAGIPFEGSGYGKSFLMGDFEDKTGWDGIARLYFTPNGSVESFPLPGKRRRFVLRTPFFIKEYESDFLLHQIPLRCGINIRDTKKFWESGFSIKHYLAGEFYKDRIFLCGDAAHVMSPIGGQNMNTGFADAELAVWSVNKILKEAGNAKHISSLYTGLRRRASIVATKRAAMMTNIGTSGGHFWSALRNGFTFLLLHLPVKKYLASFFTMQTIPYRNIEVSMKKLKGVSKL